MAIILIEPDGAGNSQVCHYGGDSGDTDRYRKGTLYFYNNTVVSTRTGNTTLLRLSSIDESCDCRNNIVYTTASGSHLAITNDEGTVNLLNNWLKENWRKSHSNPDAIVHDVSGNVEGDTTGFMDSDDREFRLTPGSPCINSGTELADAALPAHNVAKEYVKHQRARSRFSDGQPDIGALECDPDTDSDTIPDRWELQHSGDLATMTATSDNDGDGLLDWQERIAGTDPTDALSLLAITGLKVENGSDFVIQWRSTTGVCYTVGFVTDLAQTSFVRATSGILATPPLNTHTEVLDGLERAYYRIEAEE